MDSKVNCTECNKPLDLNEVWAMKGKVYHPECVQGNKTLMEQWNKSTVEEIDLR
jgi:hypothetical protein